MARQSVDAVVKMLYDAGFRGADLVAVAAILFRESGYNDAAEAHNNTEDSYGLGQINWRAWGSFLQKAGIAQTPQDLLNPATNIRAIRALWLNSHYTPWGPYKKVSAMHNVPQSAIDNALNSATKQGLIKGSKTVGTPTGGSQVVDAIAFAKQQVAWLQAGARSSPLDPESDKGAIGAVNEVGGSIVDAVSNLNPVNSIVDILKTMLNPEFWKRVGIGALGVGLIVVGIFLFTDIDADTVAGSALGSLAKG